MDTKRSTASSFSPSFIPRQQLGEANDGASVIRYPDSYSAKRYSYESEFDTPFASMTGLLPFMKKVGVGKTGARQLDRQEADDAMTAVLSGYAHPVTFGAFFMGLRYKGESPEELAGFLDAMNRSVERPARPAPAGLLNCAGAYDGKERTCNVGIPAALITAAAGVPILLHGARDVPTKFGMTASHVLEVLGVETMRSVDAVNEDLHSVGIGYLEQAIFNPRLHTLLQFRSQVGKRTILNTMETLSNPMGAENHLGGFFHDAYAELVCHTLQKNCSQFRRVVVVKGIEGSDELRPGGVFLAQLIDGEYTTLRVDSDALNLPVHISDLSAPTESLELRIEASVQRILQLLDSPEQASAFKNIVLLNSGIRIYAAGKATGLEQAIAMADQALENGAAKVVLEQWQKRRSSLESRIA